ALFTIANRFGESVRGAWKNIVDCLLKLKRLRLLPQSVVEQDGSVSSRLGPRPKSDSAAIFPSSHRGAGTSRHVSGMIGRFSQFLSLDGGGESLLCVGNEFENNLKIIQQCQIGSMFTESGKLPDESLQNLGRALIFAAGGKGQKFSTPIEEEETAIVVLFKVAVKLLPGQATPDRLAEELICKSINLMWKLDKEILDTCCEGISDSSSGNSSPSVEDASRMGNLATNMFIKLAETLRKTSLVRREEIRNQAVTDLGRSFALAAAGDLDFGPAGCLACFNLVIFAMVDD
uniref:SEC7 domain-containing protein n=1 Tax=Aegilops tauschii subsp. strangulata TaxID=200361 RepID=A0A453F7M1_AEGTS